MGYKLVALDMDGTLLNNKGMITEKTLDAIHEAQKRGVLVTLSTGRPIQGVDKYNGQLGIEAPVIIYNGAMIVHAKTKEILYEQNLDTADAKRILELGEKIQTTMCIWSRNQLYVNEMNDKVNVYRQLSDVTPIVVKEYGKLLEQGITKILWNDEVKRMPMIETVLAEAGLEDVTYCTSKPMYMELFSSQVSKAKAMEKIGEITGIAQSEMIGIGDGKNDLSMIEYAGLGVAMGNAPDAVKEKADTITLSNECDGIAEVIRKYILQ